MQQMQGFLVELATIFVIPKTHSLSITELLILFVMCYFCQLLQDQHVTLIRV